MTTKTPPFLRTLILQDKQISDLESRLTEALSEKAALKAQNDSLHESLQKAQELNDTSFKLVQTMLAELIEHVKGMPS